MMNHVLSLLTFVPLAGMILLLFLPSRAVNLIRWTALLFTAIPLAIAVPLFVNFDRAQPGMQYVEHLPWIEAFHIEYFMGADGLSITMILLTALLGPICILASWGIDKAVKGYMALFLLLQTGMMGVFCALDFFLFYIFWEVMLLPMYFLIGIWGGPRREYAAIKFFLYTLLGSVLMLLVMLALYFHQEPHTFNMLELAGRNATYLRSFQMVCWMGLFIGFAIKVPVFPFHTWLPDAHVEAPTAISVILAGILLKMGIYGILRISYPIFPEATRAYAGMLAALGVVNILYGAFCAMAQSDLKKLVAYSSISHMGYCLLGMSAFTQEGINGAVLQMFNHGTVTAMLFLLVGVIYDRAHHREISGFGGLYARMPNYTGVLSLAFFAALGLPGLSSFISEVLVFLGSFRVYPVHTIIAVLSVVITAGYMLWTLQRIFLGPLNEKYASLPDINARELTTLVPLGIIVVILGVYPMPALDLIQASLAQLLTRI